MPVAQMASCPPLQRLCSYTTNLDCPPVFKTVSVTPMRNNNSVNSLSLLDTKEVLYKSLDYFITKCIKPALFYCQGVVSEI